LFDKHKEVIVLHQQPDRCDRHPAKTQVKAHCVDPLNEADDPDHSQSENLTTSNANRRRTPFLECWLRLVDLSRDAAFAVSITVLVGLSLVLLVNTVRVVVVESDSLATAVINGVNGILLTIIVLELARTLQAHFTTGSRLRPLIVVAVIAGVRELLAAGVRLTLNPNLSSTIQHELLIQSAVSAAIIGGLVFALQSVSEADSLE
jgi:hypothetical protein